VSEFSGVLGECVACKRLVFVAQGWFGPVYHVESEDASCDEWVSVEYNKAGPGLSNCVPVPKPRFLRCSICK
jgi:hypothetical protein